MALIPVTVRHLEQLLFPSPAYCHFGEVASTVAQTSGESHSKMVGTPRETEVHFYYTDLYFPGHTHILVWNGTRGGPKAMTPTVPVSAYPVELSLLTVPFPCGNQLESCLSILKPHQWVGFKTFTSRKMRLGDIVKYLFMCSRMFLKNQGAMYSVCSSGRCLPLLYNSLYASSLHPNQAVLLYTNMNNVFLGLKSSNKD